MPSASVSGMSDDLLPYLQLLQLADSALPVGALSHSFGLETLVADEVLTVPRLDLFLADYLSEAGALEGWFCRTAYHLADQPDLSIFAHEWIELNLRIGAFKPARESRAASAMLGRRLLHLVLDLHDLPVVQQAVAIARQASVDLHYSAAFGLTAAALGQTVDLTVLSYLHQMLTGIVSACQRLLPLGQTQASRLIWNLKPALITVAQRSQDWNWQDASVSCCMPLVDMGGMRHTTLPTRLFMS